MNRSEISGVGPWSRVNVLGAGAWGTALAMNAARAGRAVTLWTRDPAHAQALARDRENALYLPGLPLDAAITPTADLAKALEGDVLLAAVPAQHVRSVLRRAAAVGALNRPVALCAKGVEQGTLALMSDVLREEAPGASPLVLSGPGFAKDVARGLPTATTIAAADPGLAERLAATLATPTFRPYLSNDLVGAQIGGAVKNVIAIACGIAHGRALGDGARAALITRGFAESCRLGLALGARIETLNGLAGLGDLVLTCTSLASRNTSLGAAIAEGRALSEVLASRRSVAEGAASAPAILALAARHGVEMPICAAVEAVLQGGLSVDGAIEALLRRPLRAEGFA